jgi:hypothetical protein
MLQTHFHEHGEPTRRSGIESVEIRQLATGRIGLRSRGHGHLACSTCAAETAKWPIRYPVHSGTTRPRDSARMQQRWRKPPSGQFGVGRNAALAVAWIHPPTRQVANSWFGAAVRCATNLREPRPAGCRHLQRAPGDRAVSAADTRAGSTGPDTCPQPVDAPLGAVRPRKRRYSGEDALSGRRTPYR